MAEESDSYSAEEPFDDSDADPDFNESESSSESSNHDEIKITKKGRKRLRNESKQKLNKRLKDSGKTYKAYRGKGVEKPVKQSGPSCACKRKCYEKVPESIRLELFSKFWEYENYNIQNTYLWGCLIKKNIQRRTRNRDTKRSGTIQYTIKFKNCNYIICKNAFLSIHGIGRGRLEHIIKKMKAGLPDRDQRGKHGKHKKLYNEADIDNFRQFIEQLPRYESHYSRNKNENRQYMSMEHSIESLYREYEAKCYETQKKPVSSDKFRRVFTENFNISFKSPKSDTCATCDEFKVKIENAKVIQDEQELETLTAQKELHLRKAEAARAILKTAVEESSKKEGVHVITFDLQQALPTPKLTTGPCFYKKKLWCYNFSIHRCNKPEQGHFFLWNEAVAKRGSDEIASCLKKYFEDFDIKGDTLYAMSDNCCGQNKNWTIVGFWLYLLSQNRFKKIVHVFPQVGHSMLPSDRDFAVVEKHSKKYPAIYSPVEWETVLNNAQKKNPFKVTVMHSEDFYNFSKIREHFSQTNTSEDHIRIGISSCVKLELDASQPLKMLAFESYTGVPTEISLEKKRGRPSTATGFLQNFQLSKKYEGDLPIEQSKLAHVMSCMQWIPPIHHPFYYNLKSFAKE